MTIRSAGFALFTLLASGTSVAASTGFQGLPWTATRPQITAKFGGQVKLHECTGLWKEVSEASGNECNTPYIDPYTVADIPFRAYFYLSASTHRLRSVELSFNSHYWTDPPADMGPQLRTLREALELKYGTPAHDFQSHSALKATKWLTSNTEITLYVMTHTMPTEHEPYTDVTVSYRPRPTRAASKL